jgi:hypothetical protein
MAGEGDKGLRLAAEDAEDLAVISAALQDAVVRVGDAEFDQAARRFVIAANRYRWERDRGRRARERVRAGLQLAGVLAVRSRGLDRSNPDAFAVLLSVEFDAAAEPPGGAVRLVFAGGGEIALDVECVDAILADVSRPWPTRRRPKHDV